MIEIPSPPHASAGPSFELACPACRAPLDVRGDVGECIACRSAYARHDGIWRFLSPERASHFAQFTREYQTVRQAEGWGAEGPDYYRALPWRDLTGRFADLWRIRARTFDAFLERVLLPYETRRGEALTVLDLGAGNCWLAYRMAQRGHRVAAVDVGANARDGLGAHVHYDVPFAVLQAEFDRLPVMERQVDLAIFNASLHYSPDYGATLREALRVLRADSRIVVLDSPLYRDPASGAQMVREREAQFERTYGFPSNVLASESYLTPGRLAELAAGLHLRWQVLTPFYGWRWALRPWRARLRGHREPASFGVIVGTPLTPPPIG